MKEMLKMVKSLGHLFGGKAKTNQQSKEACSEVPTTRVINPRVTPIEGMPFAVIERGEHDYVVVFGQNMITPKSFYSIGAAKKWVEQLDWISILNVVGIYVEHALKEQSLTKKN